MIDVEKRIYSSKHTQNGTTGKWHCLDGCMMHFFIGKLHFTNTCIYPSVREGKAILNFHQEWKMNKCLDFHDQPCPILREAAADVPAASLLVLYTSS